MRLDLVRTDHKRYSAFRASALRLRTKKFWVDADEKEPDFSGLFFIKHRDFLGDIDVAEFFINSKGKRFWLTPSRPTHWAEIETYEYTYEDGTPVYDEYT
jgi:hypothetical protein